MTIEIDDPSALAEEYLNRKFRPDGILGLRYWLEEFYAWKGDRYLKLPANHIRCDLDLFIESVFKEDYEAKLANIDPDKAAPKKKKGAKAITANVLSYVEAKTFLADFVPMNQWLGNGPHAEEDRPVFIPVKNGIIDVRQVIAGESISLIPHSPEWFCASCLPMCFDADAEWPRWAAFLETNLQGNANKHDMLQQWFGYLLTPDTSFQRFFIMEGDGSNGKSVICAAMVAMLGFSNVCHVPLEDFGEKFSLGATAGKLANIVAEVGDGDKIAESKLKAYTTGESITIDRKNKSHVTLRPTARLVFATNQMPRWADKSSAIWRRMLYLSLPFKVPERDKIEGMDKPEYWSSEAPGILNWALYGLQELMKNRKFTEPDCSIEIKEHCRSEGNPPRMFLEEEYEFTGAEADWIVIKDSYAAYREWSVKSGYQPMNSGNFGKEAMRLWPDIKKIRLRDGIDRSWAWSGVRRRESWRNCEIDLSQFN